MVGDSASKWLLGLHSVESAPWQLKQYLYTRDLEILESFRPAQVISTGRVHGFLPPGKWEPYLASLPDKTLAQFFRRGMREGFRVWFNSSSPLWSAKGNLASVEEHPVAVREYIEDELRQATIRSALPGEVVHTSPIGLIPKGGQPGKFRLIVDLSSPHRASVKDGINPELCSLSYSSVDEAVAWVHRCRRGALMAKLDLKSAYPGSPYTPMTNPCLGCRGRAIHFVTKLFPLGYVWPQSSLLQWPTAFHGPCSVKG
uniref:Reverse transcriptase domain-containing protein n=1 Tax=Amphimedon queenslandica TaxID=400682 RepID=A0A1X7T116_AMPQE